MLEIIRVGTIELRFLLNKHETGGALDMFEMSLPAAGRMPVPHYHRDWEETVYGLSGTTTFNVDGKPVEVGPGESLFIPRGIVHGFNNFSTETVRCLSVLTPGVLGPEYFRELGAELAKGGAPDPAAMGAIMQRHGLIPVAPG